MFVLGRSTSVLDIPGSSYLKMISCAYPLLKQSSSIYYDLIGKYYFRVNRLQANKYGYYMIGYLTSQSQRSVFLDIDRERHAKLVRGNFSAELNGTILSRIYRNLSLCFENSYISSEIKRLRYLMNMVCLKVSFILSPVSLLRFEVLLIKKKKCLYTDIFSGIYTSYVDLYFYLLKNAIGNAALKRNFINL